MYWFFPMRVLLFFVLVLSLVNIAFSEESNIKAEWTSLELEEAALQGDVKAQYELGEMHRYGKGIPVDYDKAQKWLRKAAEQGHCLAQASLGTIYYGGDGVPRNYAEGLRWYKKAAIKCNDWITCNRLGAIYFYGDGVPQDYIEARKWFLKSAELGDGYGQFHLGMTYCNSVVPHDYRKAHVWLSLATAQGSLGAKELLAGVETKMTPAQIAAAQNDASSIQKVLNRKKS